MSRVISVLVRPAPGAVARAAIGTVEITGASCAAHWLAGGMLPSVAWVVASAVPIFGIGILLNRGRLSLPAALVAAAGGQVLMHLMLADGTASHLHGGGSMSPSMASSMGTSATLPMVAAHAVGALLTVALWSVRRRVWDVLVGVSRVRLVTFRRLAPWSTSSVGRLDAHLEWIALRLRGPPWGTGASI
jgi:hypothetical protein